MTAEGSDIIMLLNSFQQIYLSTEEPLGLLLLWSQRIRVNSSFSFMQEYRVTVGKLYLRYIYECVYTYEYFTLWKPLSDNWVSWRWVLCDMKNGWESREHHGFCFQTHLFPELNSLLAEKSQPWFSLASV